MAIDKLLKSYDLPASNDQLLIEFIRIKEADIYASIVKMWDDFVADQPIVDALAETMAPNAELVAGSADTIGPDAAALQLNEQNTGEALNGTSKPDGTSLPLIQTISTNTTAQMNNTRGQSPDNNINKENTAFELQIKSKNIVIPNGKVNQPYSFLFRFDDLQLSDIADYWFEGLDAIGLMFDADSNQIKGNPQISGDHKIKLKIKRTDWSEGKPIFEREITFIVNPDPKTLWKNIPTPSDIDYFKPDSDKQYVKIEATSGFMGFGKKPHKDMVAASQRGRSHAQEGKPRDDDFSLLYMAENDWSIMAVADGAGSAAASRKGAEIACKTVTDVCQKLIKTHLKDFEEHIKNFQQDGSSEKRKKLGDDLYQIVGNAVFMAVKNIDAEAKASNRPLKDFSTTLIVSICKKFKFGWFVGAFWVGDGGIGIYNQDTQFLKVLGETDGGEYAGQTRFLTMPEITQPTELYRRLRFEIVDDFTALVLMTDGVTDPKFETDANLLKVEKWNQLWADITQTVNLTDDNTAAADELMNWLDFWSPGNHDDRTIAIFY